MIRVALALCIAAVLAGCGRQDSTPLPTRQTAIDPVLKKLDAAEQQEQKRREQMEDAAK
jgi:predicted small lipoprotein YifL